MNKFIIYIMTVMFVAIDEKILMGLQLNLVLFRLNLLDVLFALQLAILAVTTPFGKNRSPYSLVSRMLLIGAFVLFQLVPYVHFMLFGGNVESLTNIFNLMRPYLYFMLMYAVVGYSLDSERAVLSYVRFFILLCLAVAVENLFVFVAGSAKGSFGRTISGMQLVRQSGTDSLMIMAALVMVTLRLKGEGAFLGRTAFMPLFLGLFAIASRATIVGYFAGAALAWKGLRTQKRLGMLLVVCFVLLTVVFSAKLLMGVVSHGKVGVSKVLRLDDTFSKEGTLGERYYEYTEIFKKIKERPLLGHGLRAEFRYRNEASDNLIRRDYSHNSYLQVMWNFGLVGFALLACILLRLFLDMRLVLGRSEGGGLHSLAASLFGIYSGYLLVLLVAPNFHEMRSTLFLGAMTGLSLAVARTTAAADPAREPRLAGIS